MRKYTIIGTGGTGGAIGSYLAILDSLSPSATTSLQRDVAAGKDSEIDGLIYEVVRLADRYGVDVPIYRKIAATLSK